MTPRTLVASVLVLSAALAHSPAVAGPTPQVPVTTTRIHLKDLFPDIDAAAAEVDLGPSPPAGGSRLVTRADIMAALDAKQLPVPQSMPDAVRVVRGARHIAAAEMNAIVRSALDNKPLGRGVALAAVRADRSVDVADGWTRVDIDVPRAPKRAGTFTTAAIASFFVGNDVIARIPVRVDLSVSADGATYDTIRGAAVMLVVRRSTVEVRAPGFAAADGDVGDVIPVQLRPSGRTIRARLSTKDEAVALEDGQ
jgi:flagellar basal body P-ring formation chaperone FlgA